MEFVNADICFSLIPNTEQYKISNTKYENWKYYFVKKTKKTQHAWKINLQTGSFKRFPFSVSLDQLFIVNISYFQPFLYEQLGFQVLVLI